VGQDHVVQALRNAIRLNRLAQAYLFCGTRGVGKTSMARIFAKCLNCVTGTTESPCQVCDICQAITAGQDVDVIEIDGASNNGVEQVRELRQNASLRPSRSRFKIYYIDEVHMLSTGAFNALLKTLEEPPPHVKFFFATTEANKIPITVLSRCQRYDFAGITPEAIVNSLKEICAREHVEAEPEALQVVARRAGGSMRDAQSLLDQLLASGSERLTVEVVHALLGTASDERVLAMLESLADHDSAAVLRSLDEAAAEGVQPADLLSGVLEYLRDLLVLSVGAGSVLLAVSPRQKPRVQALVDRWSTDAILASLQILAEARARMRGVSHGRLLVEMALVRVARLENLTELSNLVQRLSSIESADAIPLITPASSVKKKLATNETTPGQQVTASERQGHDGSSAVTPDIRPSTAAAGSQAPRPPAPEAGREEAGRMLEHGAESASPPNAMEATVEGLGMGNAKGPTHEQAVEQEVARSGHSDPPPLEVTTVREIWPELVKKVGPTLGFRLVSAEPVAIEPPGVLVIAAKPGYNSLADSCATDEARTKIEQCLQRLLHRSVTVRYERTTVDETQGDRAPAQGSRRPDLLAADPMVQKVVELFEARPVLPIEYEDDPVPD
jgi:DNA polymerase-3 subunit gamma/tau